MITDIFLALASPFIALVGLFLHGIGLVIPDGFETGLVNLLSYLQYFAQVFPVITLLEVMTVSVVAVIAFVTFKAGMWGASLLPFGKRLGKQ